MDRNMLLIETRIVLCVIQDISRILMTRMMKMMNDVPCELTCSKWVQVNRDGDMDEIRCVMYDNCEMRKELEDGDTEE